MPELLQRALDGDSELDALVEPLEQAVINLRERNGFTIEHRQSLSIITWQAQQKQQEHRTDVFNACEYNGVCPLPPYLRPSPSTAINSAPGRTIMVGAMCSMRRGTHGLRLIVDRSGPWPDFAAVATQLKQFDSDEPEELGELGWLANDAARAVSFTGLLINKHPTHIGPEYIIELIEPHLPVLEDPPLSAW